MGNYAEWGDLYPESFSERMSNAKDIAFHRDRSRPLAMVKDRPGPLVEWVSVAYVAGLLGVTETRVKVLAATGRFGRCKRPRTGKGRPWFIPMHWQPDNTYRLALGRGKRGPKLAYLLSNAPEEVPF